MQHETDASGIFILLGHGAVGRHLGQVENVAAADRFRVLHVETVIDDVLALVEQPRFDIALALFIAENYPGAPAAVGAGIGLQKDIGTRRRAPPVQETPVGGHADLPQFPQIAENGRHAVADAGTVLMGGNVIGIAAARRGVADIVVEQIFAISGQFIDVFEQIAVAVIFADRLRINLRVGRRTAEVVIGNSDGKTEAVGRGVEFRPADMAVPDIRLVVGDGAAPAVTRTVPASR